ncbi:hypothetical protein LJC23_03960 [Desulfovibrio sp. OttesenSCG-928-I05]|nr:hypothetical protein [Desulfovibrio sp. OttesenSCG-928-I05]
MTAVWILFLVSCAMQGVGFALLNAALSAYRRNRKKGRGKVWELDGTTRDLDSSPATPSPNGTEQMPPRKKTAFPVHACLLLFGGALLMLIYAFLLSHLLLLAGQAFFTVFMGIAVYKQYTLMRGD